MDIHNKNCYYKNMNNLRRKSPEIKIGSVILGGNNPIIVQTMTNTPTADVKTTLKQIKELVLAGAELVRLTINTEEAMKSIPEIHSNLAKENFNIPIIGDFHYNGHLLLSKYPKSAELLAKYRINPGNVGQDVNNFATIIKIAKDLDKAVRIGVNGGSLDQKLYQELMEINEKQKKPLTQQAVFEKALVLSVKKSAEKALNLGLSENKLVLSIKISGVEEVIRVNEMLAKEVPFALHLGLTEAGSGIKGITSSSVALGVLLKQGIGDTIRVSLTPTPGKPRSEEVLVAQEILQSLGLRYFKPTVISCPGCGRTKSQNFIDLAEKIKNYVDEKWATWQKKYPESAKIKIACMGCIVNGPGESKHADIGISLPGDNENPLAPVYVKGKKVATLEGDLFLQFTKILEDYLEKI